MAYHMVFVPLLVCTKEDRMESQVTCVLCQNAFQPKRGAQQPFVCRSCQQPLTVFAHYVAQHQLHTTIFATTYTDQERALLDDCIITHTHVAACQCNLLGKNTLIFAQLYAILTHKMNAFIYDYGQLVKQLPRYAGQLLGSTSPAIAPAIQVSATQPGMFTILWEHARLSFSGAELVSFTVKLNQLDTMLTAACIIVQTLG